MASSSNMGEHSEPRWRALLRLCLGFCPDLPEVSNVPAKGKRLTTCMIGWIDDFDLFVIMTECKANERRRNV